MINNKMTGKSKLKADQKFKINWKFNLFLFKLYFKILEGILFLTLFH